MCLLRRECVNLLTSKRQSNSWEKTEKGRKNCEIVKLASDKRDISNLNEKEMKKAKGYGGGGGLQYNGDNCSPKKNIFIWPYTTKCVEN